MQTYQEFFKDKTVTLMGLGLLGRGVGDAAFLATHCKKVIVTDMKDATALASSVQALASFSNIEFVLGGHTYDIFENADFVVKGAGVRLDNPYIRHAEDHHVPIYMSTALFAKFAGIPLVGVTGTRGKTTVTCMVEAIAKAAGKKVLLGGNIRGVSTLAELPHAGQYDIAVLELDSWQLQGFDALGISPHVAVFTSFYPDHMNYYDNDEARYLHDKTAIFRHQKAGDTLVMPDNLRPLMQADLQKHQGTLQPATPLPEGLKLGIPGAHNVANASLAYTVGHVLGVAEPTLRHALETFEAVEGRLQKCGEAHERTFYNDSNATTQEATLAALRAFPADKLVLIFGGADKGLPIDELVDYIRRNSIRAVLLQGTGSTRVLATLPNLPVATSMQDAMHQAVGLSGQGDVIVLSPAFASFGMFTNEYDRSDQYLAAVKAYVTGPTP